MFLSVFKGILFYCDMSYENTKFAPGLEMNYYNENWEVSTTNHSFRWRMNIPIFKENSFKSWLFWTWFLIQIRSFVLVSTLLTAFIVANNFRYVHQILKSLSYLISHWPQWQNMPFSKELSLIHFAVIANGPWVSRESKWFKMNHFQSGLWLKQQVLNCSQREAFRTEAS